MRRVFVIMVTAGLMTAAMAGSALAASHTHHRFTSAAVTAEWRSRVALSSGRLELTTWFVGVFPSASGTSSQVFKEVDRCRVVNGHRRCRLVSFSFGSRGRLTAAQFSWDRKRLQSAHLDAAYKLRIFIPHKPGRTSRVSIVADWAGTGKISHSGGVNSFHTRCFHFHDTFRGRSRMATATGSVNRKSLGTTKNASLSTQTDIVLEHRC